VAESVIVTPEPFAEVDCGHRAGRARVVVGAGERRGI